MRVELWLLLIPFALSTKITPEENDHIQKICGASYLKTSVLSFGGRFVEDNEYPWVVSITRGEFAQHSFTCSGALISSRHVLTAAHCVREISNSDYLVYSHEDCKEEGYKNKNKLLDPPNKFLAIIGSACKHPGFCPENYKKEISKIYVPDNFNECSLLNDLAIMELKTPVSEKLATPICLPNNSTKLATTLQHAGTGFRGPTKYWDTFPNGFHVVNVSLQGIESAYKQINTTARYNVGVCPGDSGGPLFQKIGQKNTIVGVMSYGITCTQNYPKENRTAAPFDIFTDIRKHTDWICQVSGVCPLHK